MTGFRLQRYSDLYLPLGALTFTLLLAGLAAGGSLADAMSEARLGARHPRMV